MKFIAPDNIDKRFCRADGYQRGSFETCMNVCLESDHIKGVAIDVGAHIGTWAARFVPIFSHVVAIEGNLDLIPFLSQNVPTATIISRYVGKTASLDEMAMHFGKVDLIKIDIDGPNSDVIIGAVSLLRRDDPVLCIEMVSNDKFDDSAMSLMASFNYNCHAHFGKDFMFVRNDFVPASVGTRIIEECL